MEHSLIYLQKEPGSIIYLISNRFFMKNLVQSIQLVNKSNAWYILQMSVKTYTDSIRKLLSEGELWICLASENKYAKLVFIRIINTLEISADVVLQDVLVNGYQVRMSRYLERMDQLSKEKRDDILDVVDVLLKKDR